MQEPKFTRGPWSVHSYDPWSGGLTIHAPDSDKTNALVATVFTEVRPQEEATGNAHLIAAATELYDEAERSRIALENAAALLAIAWPAHAGTMREQAAALAKVLAKARGDVVTTALPISTEAPLLADEVGDVP